MTVPVTATLDLWSLGHSASDVAGKLGLNSPKQVTRIVAHARSIRDPRAVLHAYKNGRLIGRAGHQPVLYAVEVVPSIAALREKPPKVRPAPLPRKIKLACKAGHPRAGNITSSRECKTCKALRDQERKR